MHDRIDASTCAEVPGRWPLLLRGVYRGSSLAPFEAVALMTEGQPHADPMVRQLAMERTLGGGRASPCSGGALSLP